jgi:hypothetical protein
MSKSADPQATPAPVRVREVTPDDHWTDLLDTPTGLVPVLPALIEAERRLPPSHRAGVLYFDLPRFSLAGNAVDPILDWAEHYRRALRADEVPACLVAVGRKVRRRDQQRLAEAGIHFLDEERPSLRRLLGSGDRGHQIYRLIQNLCGFPIAPTTFPYPLPGAAASAGGVGSPPSGPGAAGATAASWDAYTQRPTHVDRSEVEHLFRLLSQEPPDWERDS